MLQCPSFDLYAEILLWALDDTGILYFSEDMLQKVFVVPTLSLSLHSSDLVSSTKTTGQWLVVISQWIEALKSIWNLKMFMLRLSNHKRIFQDKTKEWCNVLNPLDEGNLSKFSESYSFAKCLNLPFSGRATRDSRVRLPRKENVRSYHQCLFEEKPEKVWSTNFKRERFGSCFYARGRY